LKTILKAFKVRIYPNKSQKELKENLKITNEEG